MLVTIRKKGQITVPAAICKQAGIKVGDYLEVEARLGVLTMTLVKIVAVNKKIKRAA